MNLFQKSQSQKILACYDEIQKGTTYEWREVHGKNKTFQRRYRVRVGGEENINPERSSLGTNNTQYSAGLSDQLTHGLLYNGIFYNNQGERLHLTPEQLSEAKKKYSQQSLNLENKKELDKLAKEKKDKILEHINKKDLLYQKHVGKLKDTHEKQQNDEELRKRRVDYLLNSIKDTQNVDSIVRNLGSVRSEIKEDIDPTLSITVESNGKNVTVERQLDDLIERFNKIKQDGVQIMKIKDIKINDFDEYTVEDFEKREFKVDKNTHKSIYDKINNKLKSSK